jgi:hypothetical protein
MIRRRHTLALALALSLGLSGCFGKWALTRLVYKYNASIEDKFLRSLVTWVIGPLIPVYGISVFVDFVVFNVVEFWTGSNPVDTGRMPNTRVEGDTTVTALRTTENGADALVFERRVSGRLVGRVVVTRVGDDSVEAKRYAPDGTLEQRGWFAMRDQSAERVAELAFAR